MSEEQKKPEKKFRAGAISGTIWKNSMKDKDGKDFVYRTIGIERNYTKDGTVWETTSSYRINDLPKVVAVATMCFNYLLFDAKDAEDKE